MHSKSGDNRDSIASDYGGAVAAFPGRAVPADKVELVYVVGLPVGESLVQEQGSA